MGIVILLVFLSVAMITIGLLSLLWEPAKLSTKKFQSASDHHDPVSAMIISLGAPTGQDARLYESDTNIGITSDPHTFLGLTKEQYDRGIIKLSILLGIAAFALLFLLSAMPFLMIIFISLIAGALSWALIAYSYNDQVHQRTQEQVRQFPFFLDLFLLTVQSNGTIDDAIKSYSAIFGDNEIAGELLILKEDLKSLSLVDSFDRLRNRIGNEGLQNILGDLTQKLRTGTELQATLEQQAEDMRILREELAAQAAERLNTKFKIPVVLCAAAVLLIFLAPAVVHMSESGFL